MFSRPPRDDEPTPTPDGLLFATDIDPNHLVAGAIATALVGTVAWFSKSIKEIGDVFVSRLKKRALGQQKHIGALEDKIQIYREMDGLVRIPSVERVLIFVGQNGGGIPTVNCPYNISCVYGRSTDPNKRPEEDYRGPLRIDTFYLEMLLKIVRDGMTVVESATMPEGAMLKQYYSAEGVTFSRLYLLALTPTKLRYMSVAKYTPGNFTPADAARIDMAVNRIRGLMDTNED